MHTALQLSISSEGPQLAGDALIEDSLIAFGITKACDGVWYLEPSLNIPGLIHAFVVLHGVPNPAPWERLIIVP